MKYQIPSRFVCVTTEVKRSKFITWVFACPDKETFLATLEQARSDHPSANHHCYAFCLGAPGSTTHIGMSDAGEPSGTAGKPMLQVLQNSGYGQIGAIVIRYFGGTKLGKGGLGRAYAAAVHAALEQVEPVFWAPSSVYSATLNYKDLEHVKHVLKAFDVNVLEEVFGETVTLKLSVPDDELDQVKIELARFELK